MFQSDQDAIYTDKSNSRVSWKVKEKIYTLVHTLSQALGYSALLYKLLLLLECLQFLWWALDPRASSLWNVEVFNYLLQFLKYIQLDGTLQQNSSSIFILTIFIIFGIQIAALILVVINIYLISKISVHKTNSTLFNYCAKTLSTYSILLNTVLPLPFYSVLISGFICFDTDSRHGTLQCYQGTYWVYLALAVIGTIILTLTSVSNTLLSIDLNPWSKIPFSAPQSRLNLIKLLLKIVIPVYASADYKKQYVREFLIIYCIVWLFILILRYRQTPYYNRSVFSWSLRMEMIIFWTSLVALFHMFFDKYPPDNTGMLFWVLIAPFMAYTYVVIVRRRTKIYRKLKMKSFTKDVEVEMYIINIINLIEGRDKQHKRMSLEGLLKYHVKSCTKNTNECCCLNLLKNQENTDEASEKEWYMWIKSITLEALEKFPKSIRLHLLYAYIQKEKLDNKFKALFELMVAVDSKPSFEEEYAIFRYKNIIEDEIIENDQKHIESKGIDVNLIVDFENKFVNFQTAIEIAVEAHLDFWRELLETNPEIQKLQTLGSHITKSLEEADRQYKTLCAINPNHLRMLKIYGNFLKDVVNDESESQRIMEKVEQIDKSSVVNRQFVDEEKLKYGDNSNPCIVTCSGNFQTMGIVLNANNEVFKLLGYSKVELIGQNINSVMPKVLGDEHDYIMKNYFETGKDKAIGLERIVFPVTKKGYILPCSLMVKVLPNISEGLKIVGFLKELEEETRDGEEMDKEKTHYILYDGHTEAIHGVTYSCKKQFGISGGIVKASNLANNDFTVDVIFPDLLQCSVEELKAGDVVTTLNTVALKENYMIENEESDEEEQFDEPEQRENERNSRYRATQVGMTLIQDEEYNELNLRVLRFVEIVDVADDNNFSNSQAQGAGDTTLNKSNVKSENQNVEVEDDVDKSLNGGNSDVESNQAGTEMNEDIRLLKDFKALISEKTVPKSIKVLRNAVIFFSIIFIVLISVDLSMNVNEVNEFKEGVTSIGAAYHRTYVIAEITLRMRKLQLLATGLYTPSSSSTVEATLRSELNSLLDDLRGLTLQIGDNQQDITDIGFDAVENTIVSVESLIQTGTKLTSVSFSDAVSQFTSYATAVASTALANFNTNDPTDSTKASFYFVRRNGLFPLRIQSEENAQAFHDFYVSRTNTYDGRTRIIMILALVVLVISEIILVPIVFSVHKTATKVLSLFGYITTSEISELADKCEVYMDTYLEHRHEQQAYIDEEEDVVHDTLHNEDGQKPSKTSRYGDKEYLEVFQNAGDDQNGSKINSPHDGSRASHKDLDKADKGLDDSKQIDGLSPSPSIFLKPTPSIPSGAKSFGREKSMGSSKVGREEDKKGQELEEEAEQGNLRSQKLLNSKDNIRGKVVFQFTFIVALIATYFVADYATERQQQESIRTGLDHMILLSQVNPDYVFMVSFTLEQLAMVYPAIAFSYPNIAFNDWRSTYKSRSLSIFTELSNSAMNSYPSSFSNYLNNLNSYSSNNICNTFYASGSTASIDCSTIADGLLERGIALGTTRITQISDDLIRNFNTTSMSTSDQTTYITGDDYKQMEDLLDLITPVIQGLQGSLSSSFESYLNYASMIERVKFGIFIAALFLLFVVLWAPYLKRLEEKIFRTKGMLNMIPMTIITKNENLKTVFVQGDILQAVK